MLSPPSFIVNEFSDLGVIVDRTVLDDSDDELTIPTDFPTVIDEEQSYNDSGMENSGRGGRVMKNGKVRRKLRWKPPGFRRKNNNKNEHASSNQSVVSALTAKSYATNRSTSTARSTRSIFSHFSRRSQQSFHTFHSSATPVVKNCKQSQHTFERPNYHDAFEYGRTGASTIANEGQHLLIKMDQSVVKLTPIGEFMELSPADDDRGVEYFDPYGDANVIVTAAGPSDPTTMVGTVQTSPPRGVKALRSLRPPLFKRKLIFGKGKNQAMLSVDETASANNGLGSNDTHPTVPSILSPLSETLQLERQESHLPGLESDDYDDDRRVAIHEQKLMQRTASDQILTQLDTSDENDSVVASIASGNISLTKSMVLGAAKADSSTGSPGKDFPLSASSPARSLNSSHSRRYNRPVDKTMPSSVDGSIDDAGDKTSSKSRPTSIPVDLDEGTFLEAERNLRAIHDMAAEHLVHGEYEEAIEVFEEILRGQEARYGSKSYRVGTALHNLGLVHLKSGNYDLAIDVCEKAVAVRREALFPNHPDVAVSLAQLGVAHLEIENYEESLVKFQEALHIRRNHLGSRHPKCAKILNNIGCAEYSLHNYKAALTAFDEALDIQRDALRNMSESVQDHKISGSNGTLLSIASTLCNIGSLLSKQGQLEDAGLALEEALLIQQSVLPDDHPTILATMDSIEFVDNLRSGAGSSASAMLDSWARPLRNARGFGPAAMCANPSFEDVHDPDPISTPSPRTWFEHFGDAIAERAGCGTVTVDLEAQKGQCEPHMPAEPRGETTP